MSGATSWPPGDNVAPLSVFSLRLRINLLGNMAPAPDFAADVTTDPVPLTVNFTNLTTGDATNYAWTLGDGDTSTSTDTTHTYSIPGTYSVTLTAIGPGGTNSLTRTNYILVTPPPPPVADFLAVPTNGFVPLEVNFTNLTAGATNYLWEFSDGQSSSEPHPTHTFTQPGNYTVTLTANGAGGTNSLSRTAYITAVEPPTLSPNFVSGTDFALSFETLAGKTYFIEYKDLLDAPAWQPLQSLPGTGSPALVTNSIANIPQRFFRLRVE